MVRAPSTIANLGPGFDVFGLSVDLFWDTIVVSRADNGIQLEVGGEYADLVPREVERNSAGLAAKNFLKEFRIKSGVKIELHKGIKPGMGLGSSGASAAGVVVALNELFGLGLSKERLVTLAAQGELASAGSAHPDNVSAAIFGGFNVVQYGKGLRIINVTPIEDLRIAVAIPLIPVSEKKTEKARTVLPERVPLDLLTKNLSNASAIVAGFLLGDIEMIGRAMMDRIVEPARAKLIPGYNKVREYALKSGASGVAISGAGPSMIAIVDRRRANAYRVAEAMKRAFDEAGVIAESHVTKPAGGVEVLERL